MCVVRRLLTITCCALGVVTSSCSPAAPTPASPSLSLAAPPATAVPSTESIGRIALAPADPGGLCEHLLWPLRDGASWAYQATGITGLDSLMLTSRLIEGGIELTVGGNTSRLNCLDGALAGLPPGLFGSGHPDLGPAVTATNPRDAYLPAPAWLLPLGSAVEWSTELDPGGTILLPIAPGTPLPVSAGRLVVSSYASDLVPVAVSAGTLSALRVHQSMLYAIDVTLPDGGTSQAFIDASSEVYFVERIGPVRIQYLGGTVTTPEGTWTLPPGGELTLQESHLP